jgi:phytoene/squalene synthetase
VASAVGRLSVKVFGVASESGAALAYHLGRALQMTNIVRDVDEDAMLGRLYLPREELSAAGVATNNVQEAVADPALAQVCLAVAQRSRTAPDGSGVWRYVETHAGARLCAAQASCAGFQTAPGRRSPDVRRHLKAGLRVN